VLRGVGRRGNVSRCAQEPAQIRRRCLCACRWCRYRRPGGCCSCAGGRRAEATDEEGSSDTIG
jgi:hypothetical protein